MNPRTTRRGTIAAAVGAATLATGHAEADRPIPTEWDRLLSRADALLARFALSRQGGRELVTRRELEDTVRLLRATIDAAARGDRR